MKKKLMFIKYEYIIAGPITRSGQIFAQNHEEARKEVTKMLKEGETIYSLTISRR